MNLHIVNDEKFIDGVNTQFEKYSQGKNIFVVLDSKKQLKHVSLINNVIVINPLGINSLKKILIIAKKNNVKKVFTHFLTPFSAAISNKLRAVCAVKLYWIFYGADLYSILAKYNNYKLYDYKISRKRNVVSQVKRIIRLLKFYLLYATTYKNAVLDYYGSFNYFCFWNEKDYVLLKKYYSIQASHLDFGFYNAFDYSTSQLSKKREFKISVNQSASLSGNHLTILQKIHSIDSGKLVSEIIVPLSYGNEIVADKVIEEGYLLFNSKLIPLTDFMDRDAYFELFKDVSVAFFGARRQEASGNIVQLLREGVKIFLRNDNNMLEYLRIKGFLVYSFEDDFQSIEDLRGLSTDEMLRNRQAFHNWINLEAEELCMLNLLNA